MLCSDEAYTELWFDEPPRSALELGDRSNVVVFQTLSKRSSMTGYRSGLRRRRRRRSSPRSRRTGPRRARRRRSSSSAHRSSPGATRSTSSGRASAYRRKREVLLPVLDAQGLARRRERGDHVPLGRGAGRRDLRGVRGAAARATASSSRRARTSATSGEGYVRIALVPTLGGVRARGRRSSRRSCERDRRRRSPRSTAASSASPSASGDDWVVNEEAKAAILDYFRLAADGADRGRARSSTTTRSRSSATTRRWACGSCRRRSRGTARSCREGVVMMPSYVNIGAWVGPSTMVDTWATVGSCAQIGADVHLAGGVGIGGVLEPRQRAARDRRGRRVHRLALHRHRGRPRRRGRGARAERRR